MADRLRDKLRDKAPSIAAGTVATLTAAMLSRFTDAVGTLTGMALSSVITATAATAYEHGAQRAAERARKIRAAHLQGVIRDDRQWDELFGPRRGKQRQVPWKRAAALAGVLTVLTAGTATAVEAASRRPLAVTGGVVAPAPARATPPAPAGTYTPPAHAYTELPASPSAMPVPAPTSTPAPASSATPTATPTSSPSATVSPST